MEIGSIYEMNPNCIEKLNSNQRESLCLKEVDKYGRKNTAYTASAREAISLALISMEKEYPSVSKKCLMPGYMCDTVFIPFVKAGWELCFYHLDKNMKADREELEALIWDEQPGLLFIHDYYGMDTWKELRPFLSQCRHKNILIMEDVTQAYYLDVSTEADYVIGSLRKWYAVPDGGFVTTNHTISGEVIVKDDTFAMERFGMLRKKWNYLEEIQDLEGSLNDISIKQLQKQKEEYLAHNRKLEERLDNYEQITRISALSQRLLAETEEENCKKRRSENYCILQEGLKNKKSLTPVMENYEEKALKNVYDAVPLYFPVYMKNREAMQEYLRRQDIYVPVLWPVGKENADLLSNDEEYIFSHIAAIPMDQRYGKEEMEHILEVIDEYESSL